MNYVTVEGRTLKHALRALIDTVERGSTIAILTGIKLTLSDSGLRLDATDLDISVSAHVDVIDGSGEWSLCLTAHSLDGIARVAGIMPVRIEPGDPAVITLGAAEAIYTLEPLPVGDFPEGIVERGALVETFSNGSLAGLLDKVRAFISTEETRYYLNGVCWSRGEAGSRFAATDGHRLAVCAYSSEPAPQLNRIIPRKAVCLLTRHFVGRDLKVFAAKDDKLGLIFEGDGLSLSTKLIDGSYPDIDRVIPKGGAFAFVLKRTEIVAAIARLVALGPDRGRAIKFEPCDGRLQLERKGHHGGARVGTSSAWPAVAGASLPPFGVNGSYMADMAHACDGDITVAIEAQGAPLLIKDADPTMTRVLMPMRV